MNKKLLTFLYFLIVIGCISCNFSDAMLLPDDEYIDRLKDTVLYSVEYDKYAPEQFNITGRIFYFVKIFGILKYFPIYNISIDKDVLFYQYYNEIKHSNSKDCFNSVLQKMLNHYPIIASTKYIDSNVYKSITWQKDTNYFTAKMSEQITEILNINSGYSEYISISKIGVLDFITKRKYRCKNFPDEATRIWGLANYWNIINYLLLLSPCYKIIGSVLNRLTIIIFATKNL